MTRAHQQLYSLSVSANRLDCAPAMRKYINGNVGRWYGVVPPSTSAVDHPDCSLLSATQLSYFREYEMYMPDSEEYKTYTIPLLLIQWDLHQTTTARNP
jgi:hypothetical protein